MHGRRAARRARGHEDLAVLAAAHSGGQANVGMSVALGAKRVYVLHVGNFAQPRQLPRRPIDVLLQSFSIARNHRFLAETDDPPPEVDLIVLPGVDPGRIRRNDFSRSRDLMDRAYAAATDFLAGRGVAVAGR